MARGLPRTMARAASRSTGTQVSKAGLSVVTTGSGGSFQTVFTFSGMQITVTDTLAYASQKIFDFPAGKIRIKGGTATLSFAVTTARTAGTGTINDSAAMDWALGTVAASNITLADTMLNVIAKQDGTSTPIDLFLNVSFPTITDIDNDGTLNITGVITILWENWGDNA
jgi:hypothetical protein